MSLDPTAPESKAASTANTPEVQSERPPVALRYFDRAELEETFADSIAGLIFDGQTMRIEFDVTRYDEMKPNSPITGRRYPACRLVLSPAAAMDLVNRIQQIAAATAQAAAMKAAPRPGPEAATPKS